MSLAQITVDFWYVTCKSAKVKLWPDMFCHALEIRRMFSIFQRYQYMTFGNCGKAGGEHITLVTYTNPEMKRPNFTWHASEQVQAELFRVAAAVEKTLFLLPKALSLTGQLWVSVPIQMVILDDWFLCFFFCYFKSMVRFIQFWSIIY